MNEDDFHGLRLFVDGDDLRRVEWKRSTLGEHLVVREQVRPDRDHVHLLLIRTASAEPFSPSEEYWISGVTGLLDDLQTIDCSVTLSLGNSIYEIQGNAVGLKSALHALARLDTKDLPSSTEMNHTDVCLVDISRPIPWPEHPELSV